MSDFKEITTEDRLKEMRLRFAMSISLAMWKYHKDVDDIVAGSNLTRRRMGQILRAESNSVSMKEISEIEAVVGGSVLFVPIHASRKPIDTSGGGEEE